MAYRILLICFSFVLSLVVGFAGSAGFSFIRSWYLGPEEITVRKTVHAELPKAEYAYVPEPDEKLLPFPFPERQGGSVARFDSGDAPSSSSSSGVDESLRERVRKAAEEEGLISRSGSGSTPSPDAGAAGEAESISGVRPITDLPVTMLSQIPAFTYTSHVYSSDPAKRFIKLNGRQLSEGDTFMPGMVLTSITPDGAVFNLRGTVFSVRSLTDWNR